MGSFQETFNAKREVCWKIVENYHQTSISISDFVGSLWKSSNKIAKLPWNVVGLFLEMLQPNLHGMLWLEDGGTSQQISNGIMGSCWTKSSNLLMSVQIG